MKQIRVKLTPHIIYGVQMAVQKADPDLLICMRDAALRVEDYALIEITESEIKIRSALTPEQINARRAQAK